MRLLLVLFYLSIISPVFAQRVIRKGSAPVNPPPAEQKVLYQYADFAGRWQEISRKDANNNPLPFTDTLLLWFKGEKVYSKDASSMRMSMVYDAELAAPNRLFIGTDEFSILLQNDQKLVLEEENLIRTFQKKQQFYYETVGKDSVIQQLPAVPVQIDPARLKGKWLVYRTWAQPGFTDADTKLIQRLEINPLSDSTGTNGKLSFRYRGELWNEEATFSITGNGMEIQSKDLNIHYYIYKADENEFIFGNQPTLIFYAKKMGD